MGAYFWIAIGSALGGMARHWCAVMAARLWPMDLPWGTIAINVIGSFVIGFFSVVTAHDGIWPTGPSARQFVMVGLCGGFTTFSSFSLQTLMLVQNGAMGLALANIILSVVICLAAVVLGNHLGSLLGP